MKRFVATLRYNEINDYINVEADRMVIDDSIIFAYLRGELVAAVDMGVVVKAHLVDTEGRKESAR